MKMNGKIKRFLGRENKWDLLVSRVVMPLKHKAIRRKQMKRGLAYGLKTGGIVVSMTSYPKRFAGLPETLKSLLHQTVKPDGIVVYLDCGKEDLTPELLSMRRYGITYRFVGENLKAHLKYFHAMRDYPGAIVITVDDDMIYTDDLIETLVDSWRRHPDCVSARRVHKMRFNADGSLKPYDDWTFECKSVVTPSEELVATGIGGVLYPPGVFDERVFDAAAIREQCLGNDDIWLKWHELRLGVKVVWAPNGVVHPPVVEDSQAVSLFGDNVGNRRNDVFIGRMQEKVFRFCGIPQDRPLPSCGTERRPDDGTAGRRT